MFSTHPMPLAWQPGRNAPPLGRDGLHLWSIDIGPRGGDPLPMWDSLSPEERARADRLSVPERCDAYVRAHAGLRRVLSRYLGMPPREVVLVTSETGKPSLPGAPPPLHFNLTTAADLALLAVSCHAPVGVDCERVEPRRDLAAIARRMFPPAVAEAVVTASGAADLDRFYRAWTALEAEVKADGRGLGRRTAPEGPSPIIRHCVPRAGFVAAVAQAGLPPASAWQAFYLEPSGTPAAAP